MKDVEVTLKPEDLEEPTDVDLALHVVGGPSGEGLGIKLEDVKRAKPPAKAEGNPGPSVDTIKSEVLDSMVCREWEPGDLINGIDPTEHPNPAIRDPVRRNLAQGGKILLVFDKVDGQERLVYFQYHEPYGASGPIKDIEATANRMVKRIGEHKLRDRLALETKKRL